MRIAFVLCCSVALLGTVGTASAQDWTKSKWGPNDEIGAANYMTPELVVKAAGLIKTGKVFALGIPLDSNGPQAHGYLAVPPAGTGSTRGRPGARCTGPSRRRRRDWRGSCTCRTA